MEAFPCSAGGLNGLKDEVNTTIPPRTKLIVQQLVFDCFNTQDQSKIYHATGRRIAINSTRLEEPILPP